MTPLVKGQRVRLLPPPAGDETETVPADFEGEWEVRLVASDINGLFYSIARPGAKFADQGLMVEHEFLVAL